MNLFLTLIASLLVWGHHTPVYCHLPPGLNSWGNVVGFTSKEKPHEIYLKDCKGVFSLKRFAVVTFAHEITHAKHPGWTEREVIEREERFGDVVNRYLELYSLSG